MYKEFFGSPGAHDKSESNIVPWIFEETGSEKTDLQDALENNNRIGESRIS